MSNSALVSHTRLSPNCSKPRNHAIDTITIHHMAGDLSVERCGELFAASSVEASANYGIGTDGRVGLYVDEANRSWASSSPANDNRAVTIEVANDGGAPDWHVSDTALAKLIDLCVDICKRNGIAKLNFTGDTSGNLTMHKWFMATACPGPYLGSKFPYIAEQVNARLGSGGTSAPTPTGKQAAPITARKETNTVTITLNVLSKGDDGEQVKTLQRLLVAQNYSCGSAGVDGDFGSATDGAVRKFQAAEKIDVDGVVGSDTWKRLLT